MKLTIITACFNSEATIRDTIESVIAQTHIDFEYLIIDGMSTDSTCSIIQEYVNDSRLKLVSEPDESLWDAMNKGACLATGEYICFLNSDDIFYSSSTIEESIKALLKDNSDFVFGYIDIMDASLTKIIRKYRVDSLCIDNLSRGIMPAHPGSIVRKSLFSCVDGFEFKLSVPPDFHFMSKILLCKNGLIWHSLGHPIVKMRTGGIGNSSLGYKIKRQIKIYNSLKINNIKFNIFHYLTKIPIRLKEFCS